MYGLCHIFINRMKNGNIGLSNLFGGIDKSEAFPIQLSVNGNAAQIKLAINYATRKGYQTIMGFNRYYLYFFYVHRYFLFSETSVFLITQKTLPSYYYMVKIHQGGMNWAWLEECFMVESRVNSQKGLVWDEIDSDFVGFLLLVW